jgi:hypothetical protein
VSACRLIGECERGERDSDFADEFLSYWGQASNDEGVPVYSLLPPAGPSRLVRVWRGKRFVLVADDDAAIAAWLKNRYGSADIKIQAGTLLWLDRAPLPAYFPRSGIAVRRLAAEAGLTDDLLCQLVMQDASGATLLVGVDTPAGLALASTWVPHPTERGRSTLGDGFRNKLVPAQIALSRYFGGAPIKRASVDRADAAWIHGRGANPKFDRFRRAKVAIIGCGSVGAAVAVLLAQSGIGHFVLIDPERLAWAKIGGHRLGAPYVGSHKCVGLAQKIRTDFPPTIARDVESFIMDEPDALADCDVVVSSTGSWAIEAFLDVWHVDSKFQGPVIYAWTEAHAAAGHAVTIAKKGHRFRAGFDACGNPHLQVTEWSGPTTLREPACGAVFQPYGAVELSFTIAMIAEVVLRALDARSGRPRITFGSVGQDTLGPRAATGARAGDPSQDSAKREVWSSNYRVPMRPPSPWSLPRRPNDRLSDRLFGTGAGVHDPVVEIFSKHRQLRFWQREAGGQLFGCVHGARKVVEATGPREPIGEPARRMFPTDEPSNARSMTDSVADCISLAIGTPIPKGSRAPPIPTSPASTISCADRSMPCWPSCFVVGPLPAPDGLHVSVFRGDGVPHVLKLDAGS